MLLWGYVFEQYLKKSCLAEHWVNNLIKPILFIVFYVHAQCHGEFRLHLYACKQMLLCFFCTGHWNYTKDGVA